MVWWGRRGRWYVAFLLMTNRSILSARDEALLWLLDHTPATTTLILKASENLDGDPINW